MTKPMTDIAGLIERLNRTWHADTQVRVNPDGPEAATALAELSAKLVDVEGERDRYHALSDRLRMEAQGHAMEARSQKATVHECYQAATGATGEPGNWHGAEPVREALATATARIAEMEGAQPDSTELVRQFRRILRERDQPAISTRALYALARQALGRAS